MSVLAPQLQGGLGAGAPPQPQSLGLEKSLDLTDLVGFGLAAIMGEGGFNLISKGVVEGGPYFPLTLGGIFALFQGASKVYSEAYKSFKSNTAESDVVHAVFGKGASVLTVIAIMLFNILSISTILVFTAKNIAPKAGQGGQIGLALVLLTMMSAFSLEGINVNKKAIGFFASAIVALLAFASSLGLWEGFTGKGAAAGAYPAALSRTPNLLQSLLYFYFVLAGFDDIMKFVDETKDPGRDIQRSFYISNALSALLVIGVAYAFVHSLTFKKDVHYKGQNAIGFIIEAWFGERAGRGVYWIGIFLMLVTAFISFLAVTRYVYSLAETVDGKDADGKPPSERSKLRELLHWMRELNEKKVPWKSVIFTFGVAAAAVLINHVDFLVNASDFFLSLLMVIVSAAVTKMRWDKGETAWIEGMTTLGFTGLLSASFLV